MMMTGRIGDSFSMLLLVLSLLLSASCALGADAPQSPTTVYIKMFMNQLNKIDGVEQTFSADFYLTAYWEDSAIPADVEDYDPQAYWGPQLEFTNILGSVTATIDEPYSLLRGTDAEDLFALSTSGVSKANQTWVKVDQRYIGDFLTQLNLKDFPFDKQNADITIESALYDNTVVKILAYPGVFQGGLAENMLPKGFAVTEWNLLNRFHGQPINISSYDHFYRVFDQTYSALTVKIAFQRQATYYMWKIVSGVVLLVYMCIMVIALNVDEADRMMGTLTVFLALVSFTFITSSDVPKVAYQTRIDIFITFSFFTTFATMLMHCLNYLYNEYLGEDNEHTTKLDVLNKVDIKGVHGFRRFTAKFKHRYAGVRTRRVDAYFALCAATIYALGVAIIFGREAAEDK